MILALQILGIIALSLFIIIMLGCIVRSILRLWCIIKYGG